MMRLRRALEEMVVEGVKTNIELHRELVRQDDVLSGHCSIKWLEQWLANRELWGSNMRNFSPVGLSDAS